MTPTELAELRTMSEWILRPSFYVEARVGSENHRGECCRALMNDARRNERADELLKKLARAFLSLLDAGELVRVRGLEWDSHGNHYWVDTIFGSLDVLLTRSNRWEYHIPDGRSTDPPYRPCDSLEDGKAKANEWYRSRLAAALEPIIPTETHHADN